MTNIFEDYIMMLNYDIYDVLFTYERLFNELNIDIGNYEDNFYIWDDPIILQENCKKILLYKAQEEGIIPEETDIYNCFSVDNEFAIYSEVEDYEQIVKDFYNWCGIELKIL